MRNLLFLIGFLFFSCAKTNFSYKEDSYVIFNIESLNSYPKGLLDHLSETTGIEHLKKTTLSKEEFMLIEELTKERFPTSNYSVYKRQYLPYINEKGERMVWMNCSCNERDDKWKSEFISVFDGGKCYFNTTINLTKKEVVHLWVNGNS